MKIWFILFLIIFALAELYQWLKHLSLPLPVHIVGGVLLAIASNFDKLFIRPIPSTISPSTKIPVPPPASLAPPLPPITNQPIPDVAKPVSLPKIPKTIAADSIISAPGRSLFPKQGEKKIWQPKNDKSTG